ncbi:hypothetical protein EPUS_05276 [Endocarpon pusillum Z07020]|uniref:Alkaline ceramidase 3 n=1 Tax=Endocarpon pusillum (strain Z07020 / HMAS-L-300199) TaxID=1263415 RepID=U1HDU9_ENDPU|nr:uncharacterized protein EPUS_05276 [Endocarpon pusillum Z07020]ERF68195.1 hypothetical protein EPUS_05276 [Endocarpon pusillum Z07020]
MAAKTTRYSRAITMSACTYLSGGGLKRVWRFFRSPIGSLLAKKRIGNTAGDPAAMQRARNGRLPTTMFLLRWGQELPTWEETSQLARPATTGVTVHVRNVFRSVEIDVIFLGAVGVENVIEDKAKFWMKAQKYEDGKNDPDGDYYASIYCAEIVNSFTNLAFISLAYKGISSCIRNGHDTVFLVGFISYLVIGLASFCFHTTLKYTTQLLDELAMIYTTCIMFYSIFSYRRATSTKVVIALSVFLLAMFITLYYHYLKNPLFHQNMFALLTAIVFFKSIYAMEVTLRPVRRSQANQSHKATSGEQAREDQRDLAILRRMWQMLTVSLSSVGLGFLIWNLDNAYCPILRRWRRDVGLPWGILLEGHGWWHILTSVAQYINLTWSIWLRYCLNGEQDDVELVWPSFFTSVPVVEPTEKAKSESKLNRKKKI